MGKIINGLLKRRHGVKLALWATLLLCASFPLYADETPRFHVLGSWEKGLNSHISPWNVPDNQLHEAKDVRFNLEYASIGKRPVMVQYGSTESKAITGLFRFYKSDGTKKLIAGSSTFLWVGDDSAGTFSKIGQGYTDGARWSFVTYQDVAIGFNANEQPIKYDGLTNITANTDGHRTASDVVSEIGAVFAELDTGTDLDASKWYQYKIAFYDGTTYFFSQAKSNPLNTGSSVHNIALTDIPIGPAGTTQRLIYRTSGESSRANVVASSTYFLVTTISNNTATTFADAVTDATIEADNAPTRSTAEAGTEVTPPKGKFALIHKDRLWTARTSSSKSTVFFSALFRSGHFLPADTFDIRPDDGDEITFLKEHLGIMTIGKTTTIQKLYTNAVAASNWAVSAPFSFVGAPAPYTVAATPLGIFYLGRDGVYRFTGQRSELISDAVTPDMKDILQASIGDATGVYFRNEYHLAYASDAAGGSANNRVLVYDIIRDAYTIDRKSIDAFATLDSGTDFGVLYMGSSSADGKVWINTPTVDLLDKRFKSEFDLGTYDDARSAGVLTTTHPHLPAGTETDFNIELSWDLTINNMSGTIDSQSGDIDRPDTNGTWVSEIYQIDAQSLTTLKWNETLGATGDITWDVKPCDDAACSGESYTTGFTDPSGSDLTGLTADVYIQLRANLTTTDINNTPTLDLKDNFVFRLFYSKSGSTTESSVSSLTDTGWKDFGAPGYEKYLDRIRVFYAGVTGTVNFRYKNIEGDIDKNFDIDLTIQPNDDDADEYAGVDDQRIYTRTMGSDEKAVGYAWKYIITETSTDGDYKIQRIETEWFLEEIIV